MIVKFTQHTDRVKGTSFHPTRPWLLTALYSGTISLYDYRLQQVVDKYEGHQGPVRTVQFHPRLSLFASGGDDMTVRVWNYNTRKEQFLLKGHLDYVRCVNFHCDQPWVISCSDDQTARIWNYQSRQMIAILTGHSNYVMQCQFHPDPTKELIVTCSLDMTARLWSYAPLKQKYQRKQSDLPISGAEVNVIQIMSQHKDQLNWCCFHPTQALIATAADDKKIILWKYTDTKAWVLETLSGHTGNVNSVVFHPKEEVLISNSDDKTTKVWDLKTYKEISSYTNKEQDRFWIVSAHQDNYYFSCGSDTCLFIFTLFPDRVPIVLQDDNTLIVASKKTIRQYSLNSKSFGATKDLSTHTSNISQNLLKDNIIAINKNPYNQSPQYLIKLQPETKYASTKFVLLGDDVRFLFAKSAAFIGKTKLVHVSEEKVLYLDQSVLLNDVEGVFPTPGGKVLVSTEGLIQIFDPMNRKVIAQGENDQRIKNIHWTLNLVAVQSKTQIVVYTKTLTKVQTIDEKAKIKSVIWADESLLLYTTKAQVKFALLNGETGVIKSTEHICYIIKAIPQKDTSFLVTGIDNLGNPFQEVLDLSDALFKLALFEKNVPFIQQQLESKKHFGDAMVGYLFRKNHSSLAMSLIQDPKARFQVALQSNNLEVATKMAVQLNDNECYEQLGQEALRQGNMRVVEFVYQRLKQSSKLSFLYCLTGDITKQQQLQDTNDDNLRLQTSTFLYDSVERVKQLVESDQYPLAYFSAICNGLKEESKEIEPMLVKYKEEIRESIQFMKQINPQPLTPLEPLSVNTEFKWPHHHISVDELIQLQGNDEQIKLEDELAKFSQNQEVLIDLSVPQKKVVKEVEEEVDVEGDGQWGIDDDIQIEDEDQFHSPRNEHDQQLDETHIRHGVTQPQLAKSSKSQSAAVLILNGFFQEAIQTLRKQISLKNSKPLLDIASQMIRTRQQVIAQIPFLIAPVQYIETPVNNLDQLRQLAKQGYRFTTEGKFTDTLNTFQQLIKRVPLVQVGTKEEWDEVIQITDAALNYFLAMKCELSKKKCGDNQARVLELGCYMALCNLQPSHRSLTLRSTLSLAYKLKNFITGAQIAKKLLELLKNAPEGASWAKAEIVQNAQKVLKSCESQATNALQINFEEGWLYDEQIVKRLTASTLQIADNVIRSPFVGAAYESSELGSVCVVSEMCTVQQSSLGLKLLD